MFRFLVLVIFLFEIIFGANKDFLAESLEPLSSTYGGFEKILFPSAKELDSRPEINFSLINSGLKISDGWRLGGSLGLLGGALYQVPSSNATWIDGTALSLALPLTRGFHLGYSFTLEGGASEHSLYFQFRPIYWFTGALTLNRLSISELGTSAAISLRPFGQWFTLSYQFDYRPTLQFKNNFFTSFRFFNSVSLLAKYDFTDLNLGVSVDLDFLTLSTRTKTLSSDRFQNYRSSVEFRFGEPTLIPSKPSFSASPSQKSITNLLVTEKGIWLPLYLEGKIGDIQGNLTDNDYIPSLFEFHELVHRVIANSSIKGVLLEIKDLELGYATAEELRKEIVNLKGANKKIYIYAQHYSQKEYYLASACDRIIIGKVGGIELSGFHTEELYFKDFLNLVGVHVDVVQAGNYKSFGEPWSRSNASSYSHEETEHLLKVLSQTIFPKIIKERTLLISPETLYEKGPYTSLQAYSNKLVDEISYIEDVYEKLTKGGVTFIEPTSLYQNSKRTWEGEWDPSIALLQVTGTIADGKSSPGGFLGEASTGSETFTKAVFQAKQNPATKAILMRVNSGGGSVLASDLMWNSIKKHLASSESSFPFVTSFGDIAASGGYYVSADSELIYATPLTLTGSIGVIMARPSIGELLKKLKITPDGTTLGSNANLNSLYHPLSTTQLLNTQEEINSSYQEFLNIVQQGRGEELFSNKEAVHQIAQGRVWTGLDALSNGLVDQEGGLADAYEDLISDSNLPFEYLNPILYNPVSPSFLEPGSLLSSFLKMGLSQMLPFQQLSISLQQKSIRLTLRQHTRLFYLNQHPYLTIPAPLGLPSLSELKQVIKANTGVMYRTYLPLF